MTSDYYSADIPACETEPEILESFPTIPTSTELQTDSEIDNDLGLVTDDNPTSRIKSLQGDFETKLKDQLLFSFSNRDTSKKSSNNSLEFQKKNKLLKFSMLENELRALMIEIGSDANSEESMLKTKVETLVKDVADFKMAKQNTFLDSWDSRLSQIERNVTTKNTPSNIELSNNSNPRSSQDLSFLEMDFKIANLEKSIGYEQYDVSVPSLQTRIDDLYTRVNLILDGGSNLKNVEKDINLLIDNCELYLKNSKRIRDKSEIVPLTDKKLCVLYDKIKGLPDVAFLLDSIITRFKNLNELILETTTTVNFMCGLKSELSNIESRLDDWNEKIAILEKTFTEDQKTFTTTANILLEYINKSKD